MHLDDIKKQIISFTNLLYEKSYSVAYEGNISHRAGLNRFLITPSGVHKHCIKKSDLVIIDQNGNKIQGQRSPSSERFTHLQIYQQNPDIQAVVHSHPFYTVLMSILDKKSFSRHLLSESAMFIRKTKVASYAKPSTREGAEIIEGLCRETNIIIIERHGSFTYGVNLEKAFSLLEMLEKSAKNNYFAALSGKQLKYLNTKEVDALASVPY